jgi:RND family efflux transporter MFP subunit
VKNRIKIALPVAILLTGVALAAMLFGLRPEPESHPPEVPIPSVQVESVRLEPVEFVVHAHGTVAPRTEGDLVPQVSGPVVWVSPALAAGGFFQVGEPLVRIERADYEVELETSRAAVARGEAEHARALKQLERQRRLADSSVASDANYDDAIQREKVSSAVLREAHAQLERATRNLERTELRAPYAGRVRSRDVGTGEFVNRGDPIARIYAVDYAEVRLPIPDAELRYLDLPVLFREDTPDSTGPEVTLRARFAGADHSWQGNVVRTEGEIDARTRMVHVVARVEDPYGRTAGGEAEGDSPEAGDRPPLAVGLFVEAEIRGRRVAQAAVLPRAALHGDDRVVTVDAERRLHHRSVDVLRVERDRVVIAGGLREGEEVLVSVLNAVVDGMLVRVTPTTSIQAQTLEVTR